MWVKILKGFFWTQILKGLKKGTKRGPFLMDRGSIYL
jgi:hypothetical protein